jgi:hypothetical protein
MLPLSVTQNYSVCLTKSFSLTSAKRFLMPRLKFDTATFAQRNAAAHKEATKLKLQTIVSRYEKHSSVFCEKKKLLGVSFATSAGKKTNIEGRNDGIKAKNYASF